MAAKLMMAGPILSFTGVILLQTPPGITPQSAFVNPRIVAGTAAMVTAAVLLLLYAYRRRLFILWWITGWVLLSTSMFLAARPYVNQRLGWMAYGAVAVPGDSQLAFLCHRRRCVPPSAAAAAEGTASSCCR